MMPGKSQQFLRAAGARIAPWREEMKMIELFVLLFVLGALFLVGSLIGAVFKLVFGLVGGLFSLLGGLFALGIGLLLLPIVALAMLPMLVPALLLFGVIWLIVRASRTPAPAPASR
jgi:hypothetical protein